MFRHVSAAAFLCSVLAAGTARAGGDFTIGPDYTNASELTVREGVPRGVVHAFTLKQ